MLTIVVGMLSRLVPTYWKPAVVTVLLTGGGWYVTHLHAVIQEKDSAIVELTSRNSLLVENQQTLTASLDRTNQSLNLLAQGALDTQQRFVALSDSVSGQTRQLTRQLSQIRTQPKPVDCASAIQYLKDAIPEYPK